MSEKENCKQCPHHWDNFHAEDREPGQHCYMFRDFSPDCVLWKREPPLIKDARDPLLHLLVLGMRDQEKGGEG